MNQTALTLKDEYLRKFFTIVEVIDEASDLAEEEYYKDLLNQASRYAILSELWGEIYNARKAKKE